MASEDLARRIGLAWEKMPEPRHPFSLEVSSPDRPATYVNLGPHPPRLWPEDLDRLHRIWLRLSEQPKIGALLHHRDVVSVALRRFEDELSGSSGTAILSQVEQEMHKQHQETGNVTAWSPDGKDS
jgi:hypothetical protein